MSPGGLRQAVTDVAQRIVRVELAIALTGAGVGAVLTASTAGAAELWWVALPVAAVTAVLGAAADRSQAGMWLLLGAGVLAILGIVWALATDAALVEAMPALILGLGLGSGLNRLLFGVLRPLPETRRRRESSA